MLGLRHKTFVASAHRAAQARLQAEQFANQIGIENVQTIVEHLGVFIGATVVVWYRSEIDELETALRRSLEAERSSSMRSI